MRAAVAVSALLVACSAPSPGNDGGWSPTYKKANLMVLLDRSGSLAAPINASDARCPSTDCPGATCPASCPTRLTDLQGAFNRFLAARGAAARLGLTTYPTDATCGVPSAVRVALSTSDDVEAELKAKASEVNAAIASLGVTGTPGDAVTIGGGSPTGPALDWLSTLPGLQDQQRADFVLLVTDGAPNCNAQNPNDCTNAAACRCTINGCGTSTSAPLCKLGCLDASASTDAVKTLRQVGVRTIVVGYGPDVSTGDAAAQLTAMANFGGFTRNCPNGTNAECGPNDSCDSATKLCRVPFYVAVNGAELEQALLDITQQVTPPVR